MTNHTSQWDRIPPPLFDRLLATDPARGPLMSRLEYLDSIKRDVISLMRCETVPAELVAVSDTMKSRSLSDENRDVDADEKTLADFEHVKESVLCYGVPSFSGMYGVRKAGLAMATAVQASIRTHDSRLHNLSVRQVTDAVAESQSSVSSFGFQIKGDVRLESLVQDFVLRAAYTPVFSKWQFEADRNGR
jgi:predicted component of type VI protein secretion system